jgi:transposase InsO family protein
MNNILNRQFRWITPLNKLWTDITYIKFQWKWVYLSIIKDIITGEILVSKISNNLWISIVQNTIKELETKYNNSLKWVILHSDQWFHYTHPEYSKKLKELWIIQSMSRRWNCIDNAPTESFFGHLKDEIDVSWCNSFNELEKYIESYIFYYNNNRPQWDKKKMTPVNYRNHLISLK